MKKKSFNKKLVLKKETITNLKMAKIKGGQTLINGTCLQGEDSICCGTTHPLCG